VNSREKVSLKNGALKVFLIPQEIALLIACLDWVQIDLNMACQDLKRIDGDSLFHDAKTQILPESFARYIPIINSTIKR